LGGGSRLDIMGLIVLQPLAIAIGAALLLVPGEMRWGAVRAPLFLLLALALVMAAQLVPLPPELWRALPGHEPFAKLVETAGVKASWRPLSMTPDLTLASLVGLGVPAAGLIAFASLPEERTHQLLFYLLVAAALSAILGLGQLVGGQNSAFYTYAITNDGSAVGLFANRNHQALFVAMTWPMLAIWATTARGDRSQQRFQRWIALAVGLALIPLVIVVGSRAGLLLALVSLAFTGWLLWRQGVKAFDRSALPEPLRKWALPLAGAAVVVVVLATVYVSRDEAIQRLYTENVTDDARLDYLPTLLRIAGDFMPFGTGFGSFDPVYRYYEPDASLSAFYLNHAHDDWVELVITGGLPAVAIALVFLAWTLRRFFALKTARPESSRTGFAYLAVGMIGLATVASIVDYPLRTPIHALLLAFAAAWLAASAQEKRARTPT
jgi:O-antigen ligase